MPENMQSEPHKNARYEKLVRKEVQPYEDPVCCCEPEPRWLRFEQENDGSSVPSEWEAIERAPSEEL